MDKEKEVIKVLVIDKKSLNQLDEDFKDFEKLLTERVSDLFQVKGGTADRHAFVYYRKLLWDLQSSLKQSLKEIKIVKNESKDKESEVELETKSISEDGT